MNNTCIDEKKMKDTQTHLYQAAQETTAREMETTSSAPSSPRLCKRNIGAKKVFLKSYFNGCFISASS